MENQDSTISLTPDDLPVPPVEDGPLWIDGTPRGTLDPGGVAVALVGRGGPNRSRAHPYRRVCAAPGQSFALRGFRGDSDGTSTGAHAQQERRGWYHGTHATFYATHNSKDKRKQQPKDKPLTIDDYADGLAPVNDLVWKRHLQTTLAGAARFSDRLHAAKIIESDLCEHPDCNGARCDAEHWHYHCHINKQVWNKYGVAINRVIAQIDENKYHGGT